MANYGFDADHSGHAVCAFKDWPDRNIAIGLLLFSYGTVLNPQSICPDAREQALRLAKTMVQAEMEEIAKSDGCTDMQYVATRICDSLKTANERICALNALLGQGTYVGGVIVYFVGTQYFYLPFGGGVIYLWNGYELRQLMHKEENDNLIRNAVGGVGDWTGECRRDNLPERASLFCMTDELPYEEAVNEKLRDGLKEATHPNTAAMLLRRELVHTAQPPSAVLEMRL